MNSSPILRVLFLSLCAAAAVGCTAVSADPASSDAESQSQEYRSSKTLDSDSYSCTLSSGRGVATAVLTRTLFERLATGERTLVQDVHFAEPVFTAAKRAFGAYGCAHDANEGWDVTTRVEKVTASSLDAKITVDEKRPEQWSNCDYTANETLSVSGSGSNVRIAFELANGGARKVTFSGTCSKTTPAP